MENNQTISHQLTHRTFREFTTDPVPEKVIDTLKKVVQWTASSTGKQASSVIRVTDPELKKQISEVCKQEYVARAPELWIFIADNARNVQIAKEVDSFAEGSADVRKFFAAYGDACLNVQNTYNAIESLGYGGVILGSIGNDPARVIELLHLPKYTFPVLGLAFGKPNQNPEQKPRMSMDFRFFENSYPELDNILEQIADYDREMGTYYDLRNANQRVDKFSTQLAKYYAKPDEERQNMLKLIESQGFNLKPLD